MQGPQNLSFESKFHEIKTIVHQPFNKEYPSHYDGKDGPTFHHYEDYLQGWETTAIWNQPI